MNTNNRYKEVLEAFLFHNRKEILEECQKVIQGFLEIAKRDDFWGFIEKARDGVSNFAKIRGISLPLNGYSHESIGILLSPAYDHPSDSPEMKSLYIKHQKRFFRLLNKGFAKQKKLNKEESRQMWHSDDLTRLFEMARSQPIPNFFEILVPHIEIYVLNKVKKPLGRFVKEMINQFIIYDTATILDGSILFQQNGDIIGSNYKTRLKSDGYSLFLEIFKDTTPTLLRKALLDKDLLQSIKHSKKISKLSNFSPLKRLNKRFYDKLITEYHRLSGKKYIEINNEVITPLVEDETLTDEEFSKKYGRDAQKKGVANLRQLLKRKK